MAEFKIVLGFSEGNCVQREIKEQQASSILGKKIGDKIDGSSIGLEGYELEICGGSDKSGFPMRRDVDGIMRKKILAVSGVGVKKKEKGIRQRKTVAGNTIHANTAQVNLKVLKIGKEDILGTIKPKEAQKEEANAEKKDAEAKAAEGEKKDAGKDAGKGASEDKKEEPKK